MRPFEIFSIHYLPKLHSIIIICLHIFTQYRYNEQRNNTRIFIVLKICLQSIRCDAQGDWCRKYRLVFWKSMGKWTSDLFIFLSNQFLFTYAFVSIKLYSKKVFRVLICCDYILVYDYNCDGFDRSRQYSPLNRRIVISQICSTGLP